MRSSNPRSLIRAFVLVASLGTVIAAQACGSSEVDGPAGSTGGATGSGGSPGVATGGKATGGTGGKATGGAAMGGMAPIGVPASIQCGATTCKGYDLGMALAPCCVNNTMCGVDFGGLCAPLEAPGTTSPNCADQEASVLFQQAPPGVVLPGCCTQQGTCGVVVDTTLIQGPNFGCVDPSGFDPTLPGGTACGAGTGGAGGMGAGGAAPGGAAGAASGGAASGGAAGAASGGAAQAGSSGGPG